MPRLNEVPEVAKLLATILTGEPVTHGALAVIPLLAPNLDDPNWLTLADLPPPSPLRGEGRVRGEARAHITGPSRARCGRTRPIGPRGRWCRPCHGRPGVGGPHHGVSRQIHFRLAWCFRSMSRRHPATQQQGSRRLLSESIARSD